MRKTFRGLIGGTEAQDIVEYAFLAAAIPIAAIVILVSIGVDVGSGYQRINTTVTQPMTTAPLRPQRHRQAAAESDSGDQGGAGSGNSGNGTEMETGTEGGRQRKG